MSTNRHGSTNVKRILIARLGSMGDVIHGLPVAATLKTNFPHWELDWVIERRWRALLDGNPHLARIIEFDTLAWRLAPLAKSSWHELGSALGEMRKRQYDCAIDLQGAIKSAIACQASGALQIVGFGEAGVREAAAGIFYTRRVKVSATHVVR